MTSVHQGNFLVALFVVHKVFGFSSTLCRLLQDRTIDLAQAVLQTEDIVNELQDLRNDADVSFGEIFKKAEEIAQEHDVQIKIPRLATKQTLRSNVKTESVEEYYRITVFLPYLDTFIVALHEKFLKHRSILSGFKSLLPDDPTRVPSKEVLDSFRSLIQFYDSDLEGSEDDILAELKLWYRHVGRQEPSLWPQDPVSV